MADGFFSLKGREEVVVLFPVMLLWLILVKRYAVAKMTVSTIRRKPIATK